MLMMDLLEVIKETVSFQIFKAELCSLPILPRDISRSYESGYCGSEGDTAAPT